MGDVGNATASWHSRLERRGSRWAHRISGRLCSNAGGLIDRKRCRDAKRKRDFDVHFVADEVEGEDALATFLPGLTRGTHAGLAGRPNTEVVPDIDRGNRASLSR